MAEQTQTDAEVFADRVSAALNGMPVSRRTVVVNTPVAGVLATSVVTGADLNQIANMVQSEQVQPIVQPDMIWSGETIPFEDMPKYLVDQIEFTLNTENPIGYNDLSFVGISSEGKPESIFTYKTTVVNGTTLTTLEFGPKMKEYFSTLDTQSGYANGTYADSFRNLMVEIHLGETASPFTDYVKLQITNAVKHSLESFDKFEVQLPRAQSNPEAELSPFASTTQERIVDTVNNQRRDSENKVTPAQIFTDIKVTETDADGNLRELGVTNYLGPALDALEDKIIDKAMPRETKILTRTSEGFKVTSSVTQHVLTLESGKIVTVTGIVVPPSLPEDRPFGVSQVYVVGVSNNPLYLSSKGIADIDTALTVDFEGNIYPILIDTDLFGNSTAGFMLYLENNGIVPKSSELHITKSTDGISGRLLIKSITNTNPSYKAAVESIEATTPDGKSRRVKAEM